MGDIGVDKVKVNQKLDTLSFFIKQYDSTV